VSGGARPATSTRLGATLAAAVLLAPLLVPAARSASGGAVVLGSTRFHAPASRGFGTTRPAELFNGGDPSGLVTHIHWTSWGGTQAAGYGLNAIFKPQGGYYGQLVRIDLIARDRGTCPGSSRLVYRQLLAREPPRPGGPDGKWFLWNGAASLCASA
jgi:hypothetical protein